MSIFRPCDHLKVRLMHSQIHSKTFQYFYNRHSFKMSRVTIRSVSTTAQNVVKQKLKQVVNPRTSEKEIEQLLTMLTGENNPIEKLASIEDGPKSLVTRKEDIKVPNKLPVTQGADVYNLTKVQKEKAYPFVDFGFNDVLYTAISNYLPQQYRDYFNYSTDQIADAHLNYTINDQIGQQEQSFYNLIYNYGKENTQKTQQVEFFLNELNLKIDFPQNVKDVILETISQNSTPDSPINGVFNKVLGKLRSMPELSKYSQSAFLIAYLSMLSEIPNSNKNYISRLSNDLLKSIDGNNLLGLSSSEIKKLIQFILRETPVHVFIYESLHKHVVNETLTRSLGIPDFVQASDDVNFKIEYFNFLVSSRDMRGSFKLLEDLINTHKVVPAPQNLIGYLKLLTNYIYDDKNADNLNKRMLMNMLSSHLANSLQGEITVPILLELAKWIGRPEESIWFLNYILRFTNINELVNEAQTTLLVYLTTELSSTVDFDERNIQRTTTSLARAIKLTAIIDKLESQFSCKINQKSSKYITKLYTSYGIYPSALKWFEKAGGLSGFGEHEVKELRELIKLNNSKKGKQQVEETARPDENGDGESRKKIFKESTDLPLQSLIFSESEKFSKLLNV